MLATKPVIVVGAGNAAFCAAFAAAERGVEVIVLERAPREARGGNTYFTAGAMRMVYDGLSDIEYLVDDLTDEQKDMTDFGAYSASDFLADIAEVTESRCDPELTDILVTRSRETYRWLKDRGMRFGAMYGRQAYQVDGAFKFHGGQVIEAWGGGMEWSNALFKAAEADERIEVRYNTRALELLTDRNGVRGVRVRSGREVTDLEASAVVLACGGFQANTEWRARYLGPGWDLARVRGTRFNTGDGLRMALDVGASPAGNWTGAHAVGWDLNAPEFGDLAVGDGFQKHSYPFSVMVNAEGKRFVDEGAHFRNYTYAKYGKVILEQPQNFAWQIFDAKVLPLLRDEYHIRQVTKVSAQSMAELARKLDGVNDAQLLRTIEEYNAAVQDNAPFDPNVLDGRRTKGLDVEKSNWAQTIDEPPFEAYAVGCGITFTFGGLRITTAAEVVSSDGPTIPGLFAAGELVGGIFYFNYPSGSGLTNGAVFGRIAGTSAAGFATGAAS